MGIREIVGGIEIFFMIAGLILILPPIFIYKTIKFLRE